MDCYKYLIFPKKKRTIIITETLKRFSTAAICFHLGILLQSTVRPKLGRLNWAWLVSLVWFWGIPLSGVFGIVSGCWRWTLHCCLSDSVYLIVCTAAVFGCLLAAHKLHVVSSLKSSSIPVLDPTGCFAKSYGFHLFLLVPSFSFWVVFYVIENTVDSVGNQISYY